MYRHFRIKHEGFDFATIVSNRIELHDYAEIRSIQVEANGDISVDIHRATRIQFNLLCISVGGDTLPTRSCISNTFDFTVHHAFINVGCPCIKCLDIQTNPNGYFHWDKCKCGRCDESKQELDCTHHCEAVYFHNTITGKVMSCSSKVYHKLVDALAK